MNEDRPSSSCFSPYYNSEKSSPVARISIGRQAHRQLVTSHSFALNSPAPLGSAHQRLSSAPPPSRFTRCDRDGQAPHWLRPPPLGTNNSAKSSRAARIFPGARRCARSTSRSRLAPRVLRRFQRVPAGILGRRGGSSADTAALRGLRLRRAVFLGSRWSSRRFQLQGYGHGAPSVPGRISVSCNSH